MHRRKADSENQLRIVWSPVAGHSTVRNYFHTRTCGSTTRFGLQNRACTYIHRLYLGEKTEVLAHKTKKEKAKNQSSTFIHSCGLRSPNRRFYLRREIKKNCGKMIGASGHQTNEVASQQLWKMFFTLVNFS